MKTSITRKRFLQLSSVGALAVSAPTSVSGFTPASKKESTLKLGLASYTLRKFSLDEVIRITQKLGIKYLCLKSMHMPLESDHKTLERMSKKVTNEGLDLYGAGVIYMKSAEEVRNAFRYADAASIRVIIGVPNPELLPLVEEQVRQYDITLAIHNHGPGDDIYPGPDTIYEKIKGLDTRIGICMDIGHTRRIEQDPAAMALKYADRIYDIHLKDVDQTGAPGKSVEFGRGIIDIPAFLTAMKKINYQGILSIEYEKDADDPMMGLSESVGYSRGILDTLT